MAKTKTPPKKLKSSLVPNPKSKLKKFKNPKTKSQKNQLKKVALGKIDPALDLPNSVGAAGIDSWAKIEDLVLEVINAEKSLHPKEKPWEIGAVFVHLTKPNPSNRSHWMGYSTREGLISSGLEATLETDLKCETLTAICTHSDERPAPAGTATWYYYPPNGAPMCFPG